MASRLASSHLGIRTNVLLLPPEILLQILEGLSITPLLRFAQTCRCARSLAYSSIKNLSVAIYPSQRASWHKKLFVARHKPKHGLNAAIHIPRAWEFDFSTLAEFHDKVIASILTRHGHSLQRLELRIWKLSVPIASAIIQLPALRELSLRIESIQILPRSYVIVQRREERAAWSLLASNSAWASSIEALTIKNAELDARQLSDVVDVAERLRDLRLSSCDMMTNALWSASNLEFLHHLSLTDCTNIHVNETAVETISKMSQLQVRQLHEAKSIVVRYSEDNRRCSVAHDKRSELILFVLQVLDLHGCSGLNGEVLEQWNRNVWHVPTFVAPRPGAGLKDNVFIEVDPEYMLEAGER